VELKNINSFKNLEKALVYEARRQFGILEEGKAVLQETRLWDAAQNKSHSMRSKEEASDYRYMPEPDLLPLRLSEKDLESLKKSLPELPIDRAERFVRDWGRSAYDAEVLTATKDLADYFERVAAEIKDATLASNFIQSSVLALVSDVDSQIPHFYPDAVALSELLKEVQKSTISLGIAKEVLEIMHRERRPAAQIIAEKGLAQVNDEDALVKIVKQVMDQNPKQLAEYRSGKDKLFGFFMGQCQKELQGKGNPNRLKELLEKHLRT
jgi:aspartyl-tRNA(Asn)/glutamyl-tRNA(Gln) amidotransferase subunit B